MMKDEYDGVLTETKMMSIGGPAYGSSVNEWISYPEDDFKTQAIINFHYNSSADKDGLVCVGPSSLSWLNFVGSLSIDKERIENVFWSKEVHSFSLLKHIVNDVRLRQEAYEKLKTIPVICCCTEPCDCSAASVGVF